MEPIKNLKSFIKKHITNRFLLDRIKGIYFPLRNFFSYPIEFLRYHYCILNNKPYFGVILSSVQGNTDRHAYMEKLVKSLSGRGESLRILEVGSWAGGSAVLWARSITRYNNGKGVVFCIDPWQPYLGGQNHSLYKKMDTALKKGTIVNLFYHNINYSGFGDKIIAIRGFSDDCLPALKNGQFDIVYIDGDHSYRSVVKDLTNAKSLCKENGILCGDDLELQYPGTDKQALELNIDKDFVIDPATSAWFHPGVTKAVWGIFGQEVSCYDGFWAMRKSGGEFIKVTLK